MISPLFALLLGACTSAPETPAPSAPADPLPAGVVRLSGDVPAGYADIAYGPDGTLYASWVELPKDGPPRVVLAASADGVQFDTVPIDDPRAPFVGVARKPWLAADADRVALVYGSGDPRSSAIVGISAPAGPDLVLDPAVTIAIDDPWDFVDQPSVAVDRAGALHVLWKGEREGRVRLYAAAEHDWTEPHEVDPFPGRICECCPTELQFDAAGDALLLLRNNIANQRDIWLARGPVGAPFDTIEQVSTNGWVVAGCPFEGPMLAQLDGGVLAATWVDATLGDTRVWLSVQQPGQSWAPEALVWPDADHSQSWPTIAATDDGALWITAETAFEGTELRRTADLGASFTDVAPFAALTGVALAAHGGRVTLVGADEAGVVYVQHLAEGAG